MSTSKIVLISFASLVGLAFAAGCKVSACPDSTPMDGGKPVTKENCLQFEPTVQYTGNPKTATQSWSSGKGITVKNRNGNLTILSDSTNAGEVQVSGIPFTRDGTSDEDKEAATKRLSTMTPPSATLDGSGNVIVDGPGGGIDGYKLTVHVPGGFDGTLSANADNGDVLYSGTLTSAGNLLHSGNGDIDATLGAGSKVAVTAMTDLGMVTFPGAWTSPMVSTDQKSGSATLGDGSGALNATTDLGDITVRAP